MAKSLPPRVLVIAGSDSGGGAGIQADVKTISALGGYAMTAITALTAQNTRGVNGVFETPPEFVAAQIEACVSDIGFDAIKIGMLSSTPTIDLVADRIGWDGLGPVVLDPVMVAKGGARLLAPASVDAIRRRLLPLARVVTPNLPEAEALTGLTVTTLAEMREAALRLADAGARAVVVKGGHLAGAPVDLLLEDGAFTEIPGERVDTKNTHGTGCIFASAIATRLAAGDDVAEAVHVAKAFVAAAIRDALPLGKGHGPANPLFGLWRAS